MTHARAPRQVMARASAGWHFYLAAPINFLMMTGYSAMNALTIMEGSRAGMAQGELRARPHCRVVLSLIYSISC